MPTLRKRLLNLFSAAVLLAGAGNCFPPASAEVVRQDDGQMANQLHMPLYVWQDGVNRPKAIVLAIHGLTLHATTYDACARYLAKHKIVVAAADMRGYGRWYADKRASTTQYQASEDDLATVATALRKRFPSVPLFVAGESLGGSLAIRLAASHPELVDGMILSAPALKHKHHLPLRTLASGVVAVAVPWCQVDVSGYIKNYFSEDPQFGQEAIADPLVRKNMRLRELMSSCHVIAGTADCVSKIPDDMPALIIQGQQDEMIDPASLKILAAKLKRANVKIFPHRGHILLETAHVQSETLETVGSWVDSHCRSRRTDSRVATAVPAPHS